MIFKGSCNITLLKAWKYDGTRFDSDVSLIRLCLESLDVATQNIEQNENAIIVLLVMFMGLRSNPAHSPWKRRLPAGPTIFSAALRPAESIRRWSGNDNWINTCSHVDRRLGAASVTRLTAERAAKLAAHASRSPPIPTNPPSPHVPSEAASFTTPLTLLYCIIWSRKVSH